MKRSALFFVPLLTASLLAQSPVYVNHAATGKKDGSSWKNAYANLQIALSKTKSGELWIARGTYKPAGKNGAKTSSFLMKKGLSLIGGFAGSESTRIQSDPIKNPTILSGDLNGDDGAGWTNQNDNVYTVVKCKDLDAATTLAGLEVTAGRAIGKTSGAGIQILSGSLTLRHCKIVRNVGTWGGGIALFGTGQLEMIACSVGGNMAWYGRGAGILAYQGGKLLLRDSRLENNDAFGGGTTQGAGGAVYLGLSSTLEASDCVFKNNSAVHRIGGAFYPSEGGAILSLGNSFTLDRCLFLANRSMSGGAIYTFRDGVIRNCVFNANKAVRQYNVGGNGGAIMVTSKGSVTMDACVIYGSTSTEDAAGIWASKVGTTRISNSIFWANKDQNGMVSESSVKGGKYSYLCVQNMLIARKGEDPIDPKKFPGSTAANPLFVDADGPDNRPGTEDDDFRLLAKSPLIEKGDPLSLLRGLDHGGMLRMLDGNLDGKILLDIGAHEFAPLRLAAGGSKTSLKVDLSGDPSLYSILLIGLPGRPLMIAPFGELQLDLTKPLLLLTVGKVPASLTLPLPASSFSLELQGFGLTLKAGTLSNSVKVLR